ncbi:carnitine dehydratase [Mycolicibacterium duvalii]|uniref:CoA transferase n=1 Tax=Mycolicibacterium duvalii TaxID=39688 RepID=A0A7I7K254_9MYCO|nr:CaiB/BaiF CoA-transferase family protein [Mycolicibacterium duvalii]MCV7370363.1 CoA transferase [Mycolicibacterium duvalii]PEG36532.1 carnitine dehydratase [Mycolicibacterium duvalii]BBX18133.1 CoA transferase [Mycolicibacterium duvalii]
MLPLHGITVLSLEHAVAAPFATRQLADLGARVIKVERPDSGDFARQYDDSVNGSSSYFVWLNRSKESIAIDVKSEQGHKVLHDLADKADVIVQNLGPGAAARLGLSAEAIRDKDPGKIVVSVTGWGSTGPWADRKAYDLLVQCETGLVSLTGTPDEVAKVGVSIADVAAGMYAFSGVLAALYRRSMTGEGATIEVSLFEALAEWVGQPAHFTAGAGRQPGRFGAQHATIAPYGPFDAGDGHTILIAVQNEPEWSRFCTTVLQRPEVAQDPRFASSTLRVAHRTEVNTVISDVFGTTPSPELEARLTAARIAFAGVNTVGEFLEHPVLEARDRWRAVDTENGPIRALLPPLDLGVEARMDPVPAVGEHTDAILAELGHTVDTRS